ncbi:hypothetical protein K439DRAFT_1154802 [Ramaria rubella]|nr:hypothetical protein K439DRAFT_1154802 [Ramaria rubella]
MRTFDVGLERPGRKVLLSFRRLYKGLVLNRLNIKFITASSPIYNPSQSFITARTPIYLTTTYILYSYNACFFCLRRGSLLRHCPLRPCQRCTNPSHSRGTQTRT